MKSFVVIAIWAAVCGCLMVMSAGSMSAQVIEGNACVEACYEQKSVCVQQCGQHPNPMECDADCREGLEDCLDSCPMD